MRVPGLYVPRIREEILQELLPYKRLLPVHARLWPQPKDGAVRLAHFEACLTHIVRWTSQKMGLGQKRTRMVLELTPAFWDPWSFPIIWSLQSAIAIDLNIKIMPSHPIQAPRRDLRKPELILISLKKSLIDLRNGLLDTFDSLQNLVTKVYVDGEHKSDVIDRKEILYSLRFAAPSLHELETLPYDSATKVSAESRCSVQQEGKCHSDRIL